jgi:DNA repair protein RecO (recombination protein O)
MRVELQPAYILHTRPYRDTSLIVDFLTPDFGRISAVARGVRQRKGNKRQLLNPFHRLLISWQGKTDLKLLTAFESDNVYLQLEGRNLYSGFYLNELLVRLLPEMDAHNGIFFDYQDSLGALIGQTEIEPILRKFEFNLLSELGYALDFYYDAQTHEALAANVSYSCDLQQGFTRCMALTSGSHQFKGECLLAIAAGDYRLPETRQAAKILARLLLRPLLGAHPLRSRELFQAAKN